MSRSVLVIGGTRFFGRMLVARLVAAGHDVTILNRGFSPDSFGNAVRRIRVDRTDETALRQALEPHRFDLVYDQMCYNPLDARAICRILDGRADRYIMASTIEVYEHLRGIVGGGFREGDVALGRIHVDFEAPWRSETGDAAYAAGKRQAEAVIATAPFNWATVRIGHVLSGPDDFTGRLLDYVQRARQSRTLCHSSNPGPTSFIDRDGIADFLLWLGDRQETGAFNAATDDALTAVDLQKIACASLGTQFIGAIASDGEALTPFDFPAPHSMSNRRAHGLGYRFGKIADRLPALIGEHQLAAVA
jgi:nucleoside-diphosphate-sugar epimerase